MDISNHLVHGKPYHPETQGKIERATNRELINKFVFRSIRTSLL